MILDERQPTVNTDTILKEYATTPLYNMKAVVNATGISPSTLRAWERRYNVCKPERSESGYRLYSDRDVMVIRWLKQRVDTGMSISQATAWLESLQSEATHPDAVVLPASADFASRDDGSSSILSTATSGQAFDTLRATLYYALTHFNESQAERTLAEAFAFYSVEQVGEELIAPVLTKIGEVWHAGELSSTTEHFATGYLRQRLDVLLRTTRNSSLAPLIWVGCAPGELHEVGIMLLSLYLRRAGHQVHYLGQSLEPDDFVQEVQRHQPALVLLSASTVKSAEGMKILVSMLNDLGPTRPLIGYGGRIFNLHPEQRAEISGIFLGGSGLDAVEVVDNLLNK